jgi:thioredoxin 1
MNRRALITLVVSTALVTATQTLAQTSARSFTPYQTASFATLVQSGATVVVHVHADWCPTCRAQQPTLNSLMGESAFANVRFVRVNFDTDRDFLTTHRVANQSTILVFRGGQVVARMIGTTDAAEIGAALRRAVT